MKLSKTFLLAPLIVLSSCSFKSHDSHVQMIQIVLPQANSHASKAPQVSAGVAQPYTNLIPRPGSALRGSGVNSVSPTDLTSFNCFGVNVTSPTIPANPNAACSSGAEIGIVGGLVSPANATISVAVPNGPGVTFQLIGFTTSTGVCPDLNSVLATGGDKSLGSPYLLASTTADVFSDTTISMTASFNPAQPIRLYQDCGIGSQGPSYSPTLVYSGYFNSVSTVGPIPSLVNHLPNFTTATDLYNNPSPVPSPSVLAMNASVIQNASQNVTGNPAMLTATSTSLGQVAAFQLLWDASQFDLTTYPYGTLNLVFRGGQADSCATSELFGVGAGVYDGKTGNWIGLGQSQIQTSTNSGSIYNQGNIEINVPLSDLVIQRSSAGSYILVNVESNYAPSTFLSSCPSEVYLAYASLQLSKTIAGNKNNGSSNSLYVGAIGLQGGSNAGNTRSYSVKSSSSTPIYVQNGVPPYTFTLTTNPSGGAVSQTGYYTAGASVGTDIVTISDSSPTQLTSTVQFNVQAGSTVLGVGLLTTGGGENTDGTYTAGSCINFTAETIGYGGAPPTYLGSTLYFNNLNGNVNNSTAAILTSGCSGATSPQLSSGIMPSPSTFATNQFTAAGQYQVGITYSGNQPPNAINQSGVILNVVPSGYKGVTVTGPFAVNIGACVPVTFQTADIYGNPTAPSPLPSPMTVTVTNLGGLFWPDPACNTTALSTVTLPLAAGQPTPGAQAAYYMPIGSPTSSPLSTMGLAVSDSLASSGLGYVTGANGIAMTVAAGNATQYHLALDSTYFIPDGNNCVVVDVSAVDSHGVAQNLPGSSTLSFVSNISGGYWGATTAASALSQCDTGTGASQSFYLSGSPAVYYISFKLIYSNSYIQVPNNTNFGVGASNQLVL